MLIASVPSAFKAPCHRDAGSRDITQLILQYGIVLVALMVFVGELGIPTGVPVEVALLLAGGFVIHSVPIFLLDLLLIVVADLAGTTTLHLVARTGGARLLKRILDRLGGQSEAVVQRWRGTLHGHDAAAVLVGRLIPLVRMYVAVGAGLLRFRFRDFLAGAAPASVIWAGTPLALGFLFRADVHQIATQYARATHWLVLIGPIVVVVAALAWWVRRGGTAPARVRRGRAALGLLAALGVLAYLADVVVGSDQSTSSGLIRYPNPILITWLVVLMLLVLAIVGVAFSDLRGAYRRWEQHHPISQVVLAELATTLVWIALIATVGGIMLGLEIHYPAI